MLRTPLLTWLGTLVTGCVLHVTSDEDSGLRKTGGGQDQDSGQLLGADSGDTGSTASECAAETLPASARSTIYEKAKANLEAGGAKFDASWWSDAAKFESFIKEVYSVAGCSPLSSAVLTEGGVGTLQQPLHSDEGPDFYCGPGHGLAKLWTPHVSACMNELCRQHDACYAMCSDGTDFPCAWNDNTGPCDEPFLTEIAACPPEPGTQFMSGAVEFIANLMKIASSGLSCGTMTCPELGELGRGVCSTDRTGADCAACLGETDRGALCFKRACTESPDDPLCYSANCPEVAECYGGCGKGVPGAIVPTEPVLEPDTVLWTLYAYEGHLPATKPDGTQWDIDFFGFSPPDPFVFVTVGNDAELTASLQDVFVARWDQAVLQPETAAALRRGIAFEVWDEDITDHDYVGTCTFQMANEDFSRKEPISATCDTEGLELHFYVKAEP